MIEINCTNCKTLLEIDDAFAGGVCRCRHCGTIQTVPKRLKNSGKAAMSEASVGSSQTAVKKPGIDVGNSGTGLDDLAGIVASSGLASARLLRNKPKAAAPAEPKKDNRTLIIIGSAGVLIVLLLGIIIFMATRDNGTAQGGTAPGTGGTGGTNTGTVTNDHTQPNPVNNTGGPVVSQSPSFLGQSISERSVAYVLDRGSASEDEGRFKLLKSAVLKSVRSLGADRQFTVIFWKEGESKIESWPEEGLRNATPANIKELSEFLGEVAAYGQTTAPASTEKAFKTGAEAVVLVPIKTIIEPGTHTAIVKSRGSSKAKVYSFTLAQPDIGESFQKVANDTNGTYRDISLDQLRASGQ